MLAQNFSKKVRLKYRIFTVHTLVIYYVQRT